MPTNYDKGQETGHRSYRDPAGGTESDIGPQIRTDYYAKKALIDLKKEMYFGPMADTMSMPKHMGKTIKKYHYLPLLDDRNVNDQGIDADGAVTAAEEPTWTISGEHSVAGTVVIAEWHMDVTPAGYLGTDPLTEALVLAAIEQDEPDGYSYNGEMVKPTAAVLRTTTGSGNLYGSSKDVGTISGKMPALSEHGGRVNRVGMKRMELEGSIEKFGYFDEYTQESMDFDTDAELMMHINREMLRAANEITEDALQIDLLNSAGVIRYAGAATSRATIAPTSLVTYNDLMKLNIDLDNNRTPKNTKIITGSRMVDTRTIDAARYMYIGSELIPTVKDMVDNFGNPAFVPVHQYGSATTIANGEIGSIDQFRIIVVPEMMKWAGQGVAGADTTVYTTGDAVDVFPMLVIGDESFTTIGFQTDGKTVKFTITHKKPGKDVANRDDPYGEIGFMSIKWYYGFMLLRPERLACVMTAALL